ncbi:hypothetical protein NCCP2716_13830 [Sporosarcina sp. NCCP-2716]|uniref:DUF6933 domain-containing protein n=1 Tax=Sporosarcina sp. NCCP-2716 TaxID=2943679 RepID=UPI00203D537A|nr:hypothetical protein [Sporosarcina sp. NCCP-2716]GKV68885.1 hypothetical protein NCCP2716_13830 [Sporosarcina sp. NCCP-2716]
MNIHATKKLFDSIPFGAETIVTPEDSLYSWHANLLVIDRRKALVLMNEATRYAVVLYGVKAKDLKRIDQLVGESIRTMLLADHVDESVIDQYFEKAGGVTFHKSKNRSLTSRLNKACETVWFLGDELTLAEPVSVLASKRLNHLLVGGAGLEMTRPDEEMMAALAAMSGSDSDYEG